MKYNHNYALVLEYDSDSKPQHYSDKIKADQRIRNHGLTTYILEYINLIFLQNSREDRNPYTFDGIILHDKSDFSYLYMKNKNGPGKGDILTFQISNLPYDVSDICCHHLNNFNLY